jgi:hypothetical protein
MSWQPAVLPSLIWSPDELHENLMKCLDESFLALKGSADFERDWRESRCVEGTKTMVRQSPLLGKGGGAGRQDGGLWQFTKRYLLAECGSWDNVGDRCSYDRYHDYSLYTAGKWLAGRKLPLVILEAESNPAELLGEIAGLWAVRCPIKYLFITKSDDLFDRLTAYCGSPAFGVTDWGGTTYFVVEIPPQPSLPSHWVTYRADVNIDREKLSFRRVSPR